MSCGLQWGYACAHFEPNELALALCTIGDMTQPTSHSTGGVFSLLLGRVLQLK